jgi:hypothetical protein
VLVRQIDHQKLHEFVAQLPVPTTASKQHLCVGPHCHFVCLPSMRVPTQVLPFALAASTWDATGAAKVKANTHPATKSQRDITRLPGFAPAA